jgi:hypothetical protein
VAPTSLDAGVLAKALGREGTPDWETLRQAVLSRSDLSWEKDLFLALSEQDPPTRDALIEEQLLELDWAGRRWARVPRVCASIASSAGFLFGSVALLRGLEMPVAEGEAPALAATLIAGLNALAVGITGTAFCVAVHVRTRRVASEAVVAADRLVERLRTLARAADAAGTSGRAPGG